jgi:hypothetical protein
MILLDLIRKPPARKSATANFAIPATQQSPKSETVATKASEAVASAPNVTASVPSQGLPPSPARSLITTDPSDLIFDYIERMAICCEAGDVTAEEAERIATAQCGASLDELIALQVNYWRQRKMRRVH